MSFDENVEEKKWKKKNLYKNFDESRKISIWTIGAIGTMRTIGTMGTLGTMGTMKIGSLMSS